MNVHLPPQEPVDSLGVVIIGGGIIGAATAYYLARRGVRVTLFERNNIASEQSGRALGFIRCQGRHVKELPLAIEAAAIWKNLEAELSATFEYRNNGSLIVGENREDEKLLRSSHARVVAAGSQAVILEGDQLNRLLPTSAKQWLIGVFTPEDAAVDPPSATHAFSKAAQARGAVVRTGANVERIIVEDNKVVGIRVGGGVFHTSAVLCAAGVATNSLLRPLGRHVPIQIVRSPIVEVQLENPLFDFGLWTPYASIRPRPDGKLLLASGYRGEPSDHDITIESALNFREFSSMFLSSSHRPKLRLNLEFLRNFRPFGPGATTIFSGEPPVNDRQIDSRLGFLKSIFPDGTKRMEELRRWSGRIDATPDLVPVIGPIEGIAGLVVAAGFSSHGLGISPVIGKAMAQLFTNGDLPPSLEPFSTSRILTRKFNHDPGAL